MDTFKIYSQIFCAFEWNKENEKEREKSKKERIERG
jgi:hypothetical protein